MICPALALALATFAAAAPRSIAVQDALSMVSADHPRGHAAALQVEAAAAARDSVRGRMLPALRLSDNQSWAWSHLAPMGSFAGFPIRAGALQQGPGDFQLNILSAGAMQPLLGLLHLAQDYRAHRATAAAQLAAARATHADLRLQVRTTFLRLFEAQALWETAAESERDLRQQVQVAQNKFAAGVQTLADVLRLKVAAAAAQQDVIASRAQAATMRAALLELLGLGPDDGSVTFTPPSDLQEPQAPPPLLLARTQALEHRPEIHSAGHRSAAAAHHATSKTLALLPEVNLTGSFMRVQAAPFAFSDTTALHANAWTVGIVGEWNVWEWGASWYAQQQAQAAASAAEAEQEDVRRQVATEVAARQSEAMAASAAIDVAQAQVGAAQEAYRVTQALSTAGSATTTDLLDAQSALTQARTALVRARYQAASAAVALTRASGLDD